MCSQRLQTKTSRKDSRGLSGTGRTVVAQPLNPCRRLLQTDTLLDAVQHTLCTSSLRYPAVLAAQLITSRSQQSMAKATRSLSPLSQWISTPSEQCIAGSKHTRPS